MGVDPNEVKQLFLAAETDAERVANLFLKLTRPFLGEFLSGKRAYAELITEPIARLLPDQVSVCHFTLFALEASISTSNWENYDVRWILTDEEAILIKPVAAVWAAFLRRCANEINNLNQGKPPFDTGATEVLLLLAQLLLLEVDLSVDISDLSADLRKVPSIAMPLDGRGLIYSGNAMQRSRQLGEQLLADYRHAIALPIVSNPGRPTGRVITLEDIRSAKVFLSRKYRSAYERGATKSPRPTIRDCADHLAVSLETIKRVLKDANTTLSRL